MVCDQSTQESADSQVPPGLLEIQHVLDAVDTTILLDRLQAYRRTGRRGYPLRSLWRAYLASFILNLPSTNALIRRLEDDLELRVLCGFSTLPGRRTFNRFILRLADHTELVDECMADLTGQLAAALPGFGDKVAVDSTTVATHSNPNRKVVSDPDASWTVKNSASGMDGEEWHFGYKYHAVADATHDLPISGFVTTAKRNDSPLLPRVLDRAASEHEWFAPQHVIADRGYDANSNHKAVIERGAIPIIHIRDMKKSAKHSQDRYLEGVYTHLGVPTCLGMIPMEYIRSDPKHGHLYRCPRGGCQLKNRKGVVYCRDEYWVKQDKDNPRLFGPVRRDSPEWKAIYRQRQSVERVFKSLKESRRLEAHFVRGIRKIALHVAMSVLAYQATALAHLRAGELEYMRWMVRKVA